MTEHTIRIERLFDASVEELYRAWTDPATRERWYAPQEGWTVKASIDLRVGGEYRLDFGPRPDRRITETGTFREIAPGERLVYTTTLSEPSGRTTELLTTITFAEQDDKTLVTIVESGYPAPEQARSHEGGWQRFLDRLAKL